MWTNANFSRVKMEVPVAIQMAVTFVNACLDGKGKIVKMVSKTESSI